MIVVENSLTNYRFWTVYRGHEINGWWIVDQPEYSRFIVNNSKILAMFNYEASKDAALAKAQAFANGNSFVSCADQESETNFHASAEVFLYRRNFCGSGVAFGKKAELASRKVMERDTEWLRDLVLQIDSHQGCIQLNEHQAFNAFCSNHVVRT